MFIVQAEHVPLIQDGNKTQTRRKRPKGPRANIDSIHQIKTSLFGRPECLVKVTRIWQEPLDAISKDDAKAEGGYTPETYIAKMVEIYGAKGLNANDDVWCYEWELYRNNVALGAARKKWDEAQEARADID